MAHLHESHQYLQDNYAVPVQPPKRSRFRWIKKIIARSLSFFTHAQKDFNEHTTRTINVLVENIQNLHADIQSLTHRLDGIDARQNDLVALQDALTQSVGGIDARQDDVSAVQEQLARRVDGVDARQDDLSVSHDLLARRVDDVDMRQNDSSAVHDALSHRLDGIDTRQDALVSVDEALRSQIVSMEKRHNDLVEEQERTAESLRAAEACCLQLGKQLEACVKIIETADIAHIHTRVQETHETLTVVRDIAHLAMARLDALTKEVRENHADVAVQNSTTLTRIKDAEKGFTELHELLQTLTRYNTYLRNMLDDMAARFVPDDTHTSSARDVMAHIHAHIDATEYALFEDAFRGASKDIAKRGEVYLSYIREVPDIASVGILDCACGRGEFVSLLEENGFPVRGVDINNVAVKAAREKGLSISEQDVFEELSHCREQSIGVISALHFVEHLPFTEMQRFIRLCASRLAPGGLLILETPNIRSLSVAASEFYRDPTHITPCHPAVLEFSIRTAALEVVKTLYLHPYDASDQLHIEMTSECSDIADNFQKLNNLLYGYRDVAVIARKGEMSDAGTPKTATKKKTSATKKSEKKGARGTRARTKEV